MTRLSLQGVSQRVGAQQHLYPLTLEPQPGAVTVLLGATQAGKTSLLRLMAGLDRPSGGQIQVDGVDVTGWPVRRRDVAMVYQQFINYPSMTVFDNIASPLRLRGSLAGPALRQRVQQLAERLHIEPHLDKLPAQLSGGQQQRVALARALAKNAPLMLLDEPLVNLDYKLREQLREELGEMFAGGEATVVYATTEPAEALLLGGWTAVLDAGELLQYGPTAEVFHRPASLRVARAFSDPPMNLLPAGALPLPSLPAAAATLGLRAHALRPQARPGDLAIAGRVELSEISGSDSFVHVASAVGPLVAQLAGVHYFELGAAIELHLDPAEAYAFDAQGRLLLAPALRRAG
ncbi:ABC transporter ATP-binding protein [Roseateles violae]|uniref:ABC transporter ATP-binding protein n=1 Tax=Roseateles violae TaxID=3058042 RepID=A0ABT8DRE4_9BURK|nr:ABC transporter ATP-binding protein [Pelomonas sp. PFR6]MDN3919504.1 ABC transporter ATP-binding protein [Pelomonas sp. PFR6]